MKILENGLPLFPLHTVLFPRARLPLQIFEPRYREMMERCRREDLAFGVVLIKEGVEVGGPATPHSVGTIARIVDVARLDDGRISIVAAGITRFKLLQHFADHAYMTAHIRLLPDENVDLSQAEPIAARVVQLFQKYVHMVQNITDPEEPEEEHALDMPKDPTILSYALAASLPISVSDKQTLLETPTTAARLRREIMILERELELLHLIAERGSQIRDQGAFSLN
jgi:Lon protease-like protein